jgi:hypothetical protein
MLKKGLSQLPARSAWWFDPPFLDSELRLSERCSHINEPGHQDAIMQNREGLEKGPMPAPNTDLVLWEIFSTESHEVKLNLKVLR